MSEEETQLLLQKLDRLIGVGEAILSLVERSVPPKDLLDHYREANPDDGPGLFAQAGDGDKTPPGGAIDFTVDPPPGSLPENVVTVEVSVEPPAVQGEGVDPAPSPAVQGADS